ncbi:DUF2834 domain-containing protein [Stenotrophomonas sp. C3(2023)]|uniref:DUF2834 domain-containing protein n=1 Tax=Stenotrophomonas sp. C3(2023) TaxID=3080277 RepID=UPI00293CC384|nr:DUF2834 domain-containing protein [Stenotrophomonas sp. C3(2023)]MDV3469070.1 DUF2834 domain-containing protein [Stenotrophomonas sp. C3(2023)]
MLEAEEAHKGELGRAPTHLSGHLKITAPSIFRQREVVPRQHKVKRWVLVIPASFTMGLSLALPLHLYLCGARRR